MRKILLAVDAAKGSDACVKAVVSKANVPVLLAR